MVRLSSTPKRLAAALVVGLLTWQGAAPAQAGLSTAIFDNANGDGIRVEANTSGTLIDATHGYLSNGYEVDVYGTGSQVHVNNWNGSAGQININATVDGYLFNINAASNRTTGGPTTSAQVSFGGSATALQGATGTSFHYYASDGVFNFPTAAPGKPVYVYASAFGGPVFQNGGLGGYPAGQNFFQTQGVLSYIGQGGLTYALTNKTDPIWQANSSANSALVAVGPPASSFILNNLGGTISLGGQGQIDFLGRTITALPEPNGLVIGLVCLPFAAGLVLLRRRARAGLQLA